MKIPARAFTHGGKFHADDVFSTALLKILRPDIKVTRGFVVPDNFDGIVYDVGGGMFDHHTEPRETRPNGVPYAACAQTVLEHEIAAANAVNRADAAVQRAYKNARDGIVVLPGYMPWKNGLYKTDALFVVYPSQRGGYSAQCVTDYRTRRSKVPFPAAWAGKPEEELRRVSGLGLRFCHPSRFLITADDRDQAVEACRRALRAAGKPVSE